VYQLSTSVTGFKQYVRTGITVLVAQTLRIDIQREITLNLAVEIAYVGNRGAWWEGNDLINVNALTAQRIASFGLDINNAADRTLLTSRLDSALAKQRGFDKPPYGIRSPKRSTSTPTTAFCSHASSGLDLVLLKPYRRCVR